jgi:dTMP kinase
MTGKLVVIEGGDGTGKQTQAKLLLERLQKEGFCAAGVSFPRYNSFFGKIVKDYLKGHFGTKEQAPIELVSLLYSLDRFEFKPELEKLLHEEKIVVCDRYSESNFAHQGAKIRDEEKRKVFLEWIKKVESRLPQARVKFFLDMPAEAFKKLLQERHESFASDIHESDPEYLEKTRQIYLELVEQGENWEKISCAEKLQGEWKLKPRQQIHENIWQKLKPKL